ncbi:MAG: InlB B-repeat-containing protein [Candidatus Omnitrophica bacterium]|nr:InlB B-repeat-containing protein [Candidatus Omnitrophota bacterium]
MKTFRPVFLILPWIFLVMFGNLAMAARYVPLVTNSPFKNGINPDCDPCTAGQSCCGSSCVDITANNSNCGSCGTVCAQGQTCSAGACSSGGDEGSCSLDPDCQSGYYCNNGTCADVNECDTDNGDCDANAACENTAGAFTCTCHLGYEGDGTVCVDINECDTDNGGCDGNAACGNTAGSFTCICNSGYEGNGITCEDVNECDTDNGGCDVNAACGNTAGSFTCVCNSGYEGNGITCEDVNECDTDNGGCDVNAACENTAGSFTCTCNEGYTGNGTSGNCMAEYAVTYDSNGSNSGSVPIDTGTYGEAAEVTVLGNTGILVKTGFAFAGWNTQANGGGADRPAASTFIMGAGSVTLYAKWTANNNTITFDANTGDGGSTAAQTLATDATAALNANGFTKTGYAFAGWATSSGGAVEYANGASYTMGTASVTLYAKWTANNNTITFDTNTGDGGSTAAQTLATDATAALNANGFTKTGYTFAGWATSSGGAVVYANGASYTMGTASVTLYAVWSLSCKVAQETCTNNAECCSGLSCSCFVSGTKVLLADGRNVVIESLKAGDVLLGSKGARNKVMDLVVLPRAERKVYSFNGGRYFVTESHPFMTTDGWKAMNPRAAHQVNLQLEIGQLKTGDKFVTRNGLIRLEKIEFKTVKDSVVYNPVLDGSHDYFADGFMVHNKSKKCN